VYILSLKIKNLKYRIYVNQIQLKIEIKLNRIYVNQIQLKIEIKLNNMKLEKSLIYYKFGTSDTLLI
jgi:LEA14-like dessication related protein